MSPQRDMSLYAYSLTSEVGMALPIDQPVMLGLVGCSREIPVFENPLILTRDAKLLQARASSRP